jgi:hypothetical protein
LGLSIQGDFGVFFNKGPKFIHLDLRKSKIPKEHVVDLFTMQRGGGEPSPNGIELDLQDSGSSPKSQTLGQELETHKHFLLGSSKAKECGSGSAGKGLATGSAQKESCLAGTSGSVGTIGDDIAQTPLGMMLTVWVRAADIEKFWFWTTFPF